MPVPSVMADLSVTAGSNSPAGTENAAGVIDDYFRAQASLIRAPQAYRAGVPSATTVDLSTYPEGYIQITGSTTITGLGTDAAGIQKVLVFSGTPTLTHSASLILPTGASITVSAGDVYAFRSEGSGTWRCVGVNVAKLANNGAELGMRNRIINGAMAIDQINSGAAVTPTASQYVLDRFQFQCTQSSKFSVQQNAGAVTPPSGFTNYLGTTSLSAYVLTGNDFFSAQQIIEGYNVADLNWGTASAQPATLSFWVRSSLTGTFGGSIATTKTAVWVMPFTYTIAAANTWTYVTVAIPAATGTAGANTDNTGGVYVRFGLGAAGTYSGGTAGVWTNAGNYIQPAGTVSVVGTNAATWYITGVQFEKGSTATPFEVRQYGAELALCQRYYERLTAPSGQAYATLQATSTTNAYGGTTFFKVTKRASPTVNYSGTIVSWNASGVSAGGSILPTGVWADAFGWSVTGATGLVAGNAVQIVPTSAVVITAYAEL